MLCEKFFIQVLFFFYGGILASDVACNSKQLLLINDTEHLIKIADKSITEGDSIKLEATSKQKYVFTVGFDTMFKMKFRKSQGAWTPYPASSKLPDTGNLKITALIEAGKLLPKGKRIVHKVSQDRELFVKYIPMISSFSK